MSFGMPVAPMGPSALPAPQTQAPPAGVQMGKLVVTAHSLAGSYTPLTLLIDGQAMPARLGRNEYFVLPGPRRVDVASSWLLGSFGRASLTPIVASGADTAIDYAAPASPLFGGALGEPTQRSRGVWFAVLGAALFLALVLAVPALMSAFGQ